MKFARLVSCGSGAALAVLGCTAPPPPEPEEMQPTTPEQWNVETTAAGRLVGRWWDGFGDEGLDVVLRESLAANHDLKAAAKKRARSA